MKQMKIKHVLINNYNTIIAFVIIFASGVILRAYFTPWDIPFRSPDAFLFLLEAIDYSEGNFEKFNLRFLWPLLLSMIFVISKFDTIFDLITITRIITLIISSLSIFLVYFISKTYTSKRFALLAMGIFAINSAIIENSSFSVREPLMILLGLVTFYFIIKKDWRLILIAFLISGLTFDVKINGIVVLILTIISCICIRPRKNAVLIMLVGMGIFLAVSSPYIIQSIENQQIPFFTHVNESSRIVSEVEIWPSTQVSGVVTDSSFILKYSAEREIIHILKISLPFLTIIVPFGIFYVIKNINQNSVLLLLGIGITFLIAYPMYFQSAEYRNIIFAVPLLCVLGAIGLEGIIQKKNNQKLIIFTILIFSSILSFIIIDSNYTDKELLLEKNHIAKFIVNNFSGRMWGDLSTELIQNISNVKRDRIPGTSNGVYFNEDISVTKSALPINTKEDLVDIIRALKIDYIIIDNFPDNRYPIFEKIFYNESEIDYIKKVYDSENEFKMIRIKIFQVIN